MRGIITVMLMTAIGIGTEMAIMSGGITKISTYMVKQIGEEYLT